MTARSPKRSAKWQTQCRANALSASGSTVIIHGEGMPDLRSKRRGDIIVELEIEVPKKVSDEERELLEKLNEFYQSHKPKGKRKNFLDKIKELFDAE